MPELNGSKTHDNLKTAFAGESQANRRYLYFAQKADVEGYPDVAALFRSVAEGETGHAFGHFDFLAEVGDPVTGVAVGATDDNLKSAIEGETYEYTEMYPGFAKTARDEGFEDVAEWLETLAACREEPRRPLRAGPRVARLRLEPSKSTAPACPGPSHVRSNRRSRVRKLTVDDILDGRAYERERADIRAAVIALKKRRRVALGELVSVVFENTETMRWQVMEMARAERMLLDEQIAHEVATYNELVPDDGELSATLFLELRTDAELREWLGKLVGIERSVALVLDDGTTIPGEPRDEERLTREEITAAVHFLRFRVGDATERFAAGPVKLVIMHPDYSVETLLDDDQHAELVRDLARLSVAEPVEIAIRRLEPGLPLPTRQRADDAGYDLVAREGAVLASRGGRALVPTGIALAIPPGYAGFVQPRSGLALRHGVTLLNTPGLIDAGYRDEIRVLLVNLDPDAEFTVTRGDRIAQLVIQRVEAVEWRAVDALDDSDRGLGGFGSTGT